MDSPHFYACGKMRLLTKKNTTAEIVPLKKSVPSVYTQSGTNFFNGTISAVVFFFVNKRIFPQA